MIVKIRLHGSAFDIKRLYQEVAHRQDDDKRNNYYLGQFKDKFSKRFQLGNRGLRAIIVVRFVGHYFVLNFYDNFVYYNIKIKNYKP